MHGNDRCLTQVQYYEMPATINVRYLTRYIVRYLTRYIVQYVSYSPKYEFQVSYQPQNVKYYT